VTRATVALLFCLPALVPGAARAQATVAARPPYAEVAEQLGRLIRSEIGDKSIPAMSIALVDDQDVVWAAGFGLADPGGKVPATAETVYTAPARSPSCSPDIAVMQLVEQGKLDLDAPVKDYLPEFAPRTRFDRPITLRQLMSHPRGIVREPPRRPLLRPPKRRRSPGPCRA